MRYLPNKIAVVVSLVFGVAVWLTIDPWFTNKEAQHIGIACFILCGILLHAIPQIMSNFVSILIAVGVGLAGWLIVDPWYNTKDERLIGIAIFIAILIILQFRPQLMGNLHKKDDDQSDDGEGDEPHPSRG
jgi:flagellar biosynthesis protein FliR